MRLVLALCLLLLAACGSVPDVLTPAATVPPSGHYWISLQERSPLTTAERERLFNRLGTGLGSARAERATPGALELRVTIVGFRQADEPNRMGGSMAGGDDFVESVVRLVDPAGAVVSEQRVLTNKRRGGVAADHLLEQHADEIVRLLAKR